MKHLNLIVVLSSVLCIFGLSTAQAQQAQPPTPNDPEVFYYGWKGKKVALEESTERIGVTFVDRKTARGLDLFFSADPRIQDLSSEEFIRNEDVGRTVVIRMANGASQADTTGLRTSLSARSDVASVHRVYRISAGGAAQSFEVRESLATDYISVVVDARVSEADILAIFEEDGIEVLRKSVFSTIGKVGYRLKITPLTRTITAQSPLEIANRYHEHPLIRQAAPTAPRWPA